MHVRMARWLALILTLGVVHVTLSDRAASASASAPWLVALAIQLLAAAAVGTRWRRSPGEAGQLWLLLALAIAMQGLSSACRLLAVLYGGAWAMHLDLLGAVCSGLYMVPIMFMIARSFSNDTPRTVSVLDGLIAICLALLLYALYHLVVSLPPELMRAHLRELVFLSDAVNYSLALLASLRVIGTATRLRRHAYFAASVFLWINAVAVSAYNRLQMDGLPWWAGISMDVAFVTVTVVALRTAPRCLHRCRPSRRMKAIVDGFAPVVLSICVLAVGISVSRLNFGVGMLVSVLSVVIYGLRMAYIQSRDRYRQHKVITRNQSLKHQLGMDPMTGIANRATLDAQLRATLANRRGNPGSCSVLMVDVDYFKQYNDTLGHIAGDHCLLRVVQALQDSLRRPGDLIARYGGEEFAIVLPNSSAKAAAHVGQRLVEAVAGLDLSHPSSPYGRVTVSVGAATCRAGDETHVTELLEAADHAMYLAKNHGRNRSVMAEAAHEDLAQPAIS